MYTCQDIAEYLLALVDEEVEELICNLKLQKLVYYAQGFYLALNDKPLFNEPIEAWAHGPVVKELYQKYRSNGASGIPRPENIDLSKYDKETQDFLSEIYKLFGQYSGWKLREFTHGEAPWRNTYNIRHDGIISQDEMKEYFKTRIENVEEKH
ncbi:MAG TPA: type II toxin-antitoxin system antitoxin SocA domain-containing protein [Thermodesulfobacteriota bacterium]|nr:type II toxin-antitoxin system antitoxin SocA domain-containing protein [Thermodesulfobacteriota bacterium]